MNIATPRERNQSKWEENKSKLQAFSSDKIETNTSVTIKEYCQFSEWMLDAPIELFSKSPNMYVDWLLKPKITYDTDRTANEQKKLEAKQQGQRIIGIICYAWDFLVRLLKGKNQNGLNDTLGVYNEDNINLEMARIQNMLYELKGKKYRIDIFSKENAFDQQLQQEEISQQITFIRLLQNILKTQMKKIEESRNQPILPQRAAREREEHVVEKSEPLPKITEIIKVEEYFRRKMERLQREKNQPQAKDPLTKQEEQRKFNLAAIRYYMPTTKGK